jgi:hypothetical protein
MIKFVDELPLDDDLNRLQSSASGWRRLDVHARRVRTLYMEPNYIVISPNIYLRICAMRDSPLLPGLKKIYIPNNPPLGALDLSSALFLASESTLNMVQLHDYAISDRGFFVPFLSSLYIRSPGLLHLVLRGDVLSARCASVEPIYRFTELQSLEIRLRDPHLHPQLLHKLGQLPHLLDLIIDTTTASDDSSDAVTSIQPHSNPISISNSKFRLLKHLQIQGTTTSISRILNQLKGSANLSALKIDEEWDGWGSSWRSFFEAISTFSAVEDIRINLDLNRPQTFSYSTLPPHFRLDNLKSFVIDFDTRFFGSDDDLRLLAGGFPKLKKFVLPGPPFINGNIEFGRTLACLYHLSQECPDLREINVVLSFDISYNLNAIKQLPHPLVRNYQHPLEKLYIDSEFGHLEPIILIQVARFLDLIFPNLTTLDSAGLSSDWADIANWEAIEEFRSALQNARINPSSVDGI